MSAETTPTDLADVVLGENPDGTKAAWGERMLTLARAHGMDTFIERKLIESLGQMVSQRKAAEAKRRQAEELAAHAVTYSGIPLSPTISVKTSKGGSQLKLWLDATPAEYMSAVFTEQNVVDGRNRANKIRLQIAEQIAQDDSLQSLPSLSAVCGSLGVDPSTLGLEELSA